MEPAGQDVAAQVEKRAELKLGVQFSATVEGDRADGLVADLKQILDDLGLSERVDIR